jgi:large subunit ribosomal protein L18
VNGNTICAASTVEKAVAEKLEKTWDVAAAKVVGKTIAEKALAKDVTTVVFDRGGNVFHGKVKALADAAREAGLVF